MIKPRVIVTGAIGKTGSVVVSELLKAGYPVRAMVHRGDGRSARLKAQGAEMAVADVSDVERVAAPIIVRLTIHTWFKARSPLLLPRRNPASNTSSA
jgi:uncharacterized protein YbjT (DUF2867 family)